MPTITIRQGLDNQAGTVTPRTGTVEFRRAQPFTRTVGGQQWSIEPAPLIATLTPTGATINLPAGYYEVVTSWAPGSRLVHVITDAALADLPTIDRGTLDPIPDPVAAWEAVRDVAVDAAQDAETSRLGALGYRTDAKTYRDDALAAKIAAETARAGAASEASNAAIAASNASDQRAAAVVAAGRAENARAGMVTGFEIAGGRVIQVTVDGIRTDLGSSVGPAGGQGLPGDLTSASTGSWNPAWGTLAVNAATELPSTRRVTLLGSVTVGITGTPSATRSGTVSLILVQASSGGPFTVTWPAAILWAGGAPGPAMPTAANAELLVHLFWTGTAWRGIVGGVFYA